MKILLAVDGSDSGLFAAAEAGRTPWRAGSVVRILSVAEMSLPETPESLPLAEGSYAEWQRIFEARAVANVAAAAARFAEAGGGGEAKLATKTLTGNPRELILREAESWNADLLMLGTHGYNLFQRMWLGSVSRALVAQAPCPVRVVRARHDSAKGAMKILLATDGSACSEHAVAAVADRPWPAGSEVRVLSVVHLPFTPSHETRALPESYYSELERSGRARAEAALNQAISRLQGTSLALTREVILGHAEEKILEAARDWPADLIVLGSHGRSGWKRFLLGSVSQAVVSHAPCSVEVVREQTNTEHTE